MDIYEKIIETKTLSDYTHDQIEDMKLLAADTEHFNVMPYGSASYKIQPYPADLDLIEKYEGTSLTDTLVSFKDRIKLITQNIEIVKNHWFSEFKAGINPLSSNYVDYGPIYNGLWNPNRDYLRGIAKVEYSNGIFSKKDLNTIYEILSKKNPGADERESLRYLFRERAILRWNAKEVINGFKILPGNLKYPLVNGLKVDLPVKIDMIAVVNGRITEVTNYYELILTNEEGEQYPINGLPFYLDDPEKIVESLKEDIQKLYFSNIYYSPFKCAKRMWSAARQMDLQDEVIKLTPLITGDVSLLYQIRSEIGNILRLLKLGENPKILIRKRLEILLSQMEPIDFINNDNFENIQGLISSYIQKQNAEILDELDDLIKSIIQTKTIQELDKIRMNPPPAVFLPEKKFYGNIIRTPFEQVVNPLKTYDIK